MSRYLERQKERREAARAARRAAEREERRREEAREKQREQEREEARARRLREEAKAFERELEQAALRAQERRQRYRERRRIERRTEQRAAQRVAALLEAAQQARRDEAREAARQEAQVEARRSAARQARQDEGREAARQEAQVEARRSVAQQEVRRDEGREAARQEAQVEARRDEAREAARQEARAQARREEQAAERRAASGRERQAESRAQARAEARQQATGSRRTPERSGQRLPSGTLSGNLPWLRVEGRFLLDEFDRPVTLRGVTVRGFERAEPVGESFQSPISASELRTLAAWGANALAIPIAQDLVLEGRGEAEGEDYLETLDETIAAASIAGLYTIVQLALISSVIPTAVGAAGDVFDPALPDVESIDLWAVLARRYAAEPAVIFDLFPSPHDPERGDSTSALLPRLDWSIWERWILAMLGEIRREHPRALAIARGLNRGRDLSGFPLYFSDGSHPGNIIYGAELRAADRQQALHALDALSQKENVGIFSWLAQPFASTAVLALGNRLARAGYHWIAGDWRGPVMPLVQTRRGRLEPTSLGRAFRTAFSLPGAPAVNLAPMLHMSRLSAIFPSS